MGTDVAFSGWWTLIVLVSLCPFLKFFPETKSTSDDLQKVHEGVFSIQSKTGVKTPSSSSSHLIKVSGMYWSNTLVYYLSSLPHSPLQPSHCKNMLNISTDKTKSYVASMSDSRSRNVFYSKALNASKTPDVSQLTFHTHSLLVSIVTKWNVNVRQLLLSRCGRKPTHYSVALNHHCNYEAFCGQCFHSHTLIFQ